MPLDVGKKPESGKYSQKSQHTVFLDKWETDTLRNLAKETGWTISDLVAKAVRYAFDDNTAPHEK